MQNGRRSKFSARQFRPKRGNVQDQDPLVRLMSIHNFYSFEDTSDTSVIMSKDALILNVLRNTAHQPSLTRGMIEFALGWMTYRSLVIDHRSCSSLS